MIKIFVLSISVLALFLFGYNDTLAQWYNKLTHEETTEN